ncbi:MAG: transglutaminase [Alteromonas sp.]|nr:transglutaminase [Alteromonas sp.]MAY23453.1 transglutaminase [Flavobacteriaceae bacterium]|tara:strand:+ start:78385 stop:80394 length:2010 start_codon:yes stop_codon:yes gene_type:complete
MKLKLFFLLLTISSSTLWAQNFKFGKVSEEEVKQKEHPSYPEADAAVLYREVRTHFEYSEDIGFYLITDVFERIKIYNENGFEWATKEVPLYRQSNKYKEELSGLKAYTYVLNEKGKVEDVKLRRDGMFEEDRSEMYKVEKFTMPSLKPGCVIEYEYSVKSPFYSAINPYRFQEKIPVNKVSLTFETPEYFNYNTHRRGWLPFNIDTNYKQRSMDYRHTASFVQTKSAIGNTTTETATFKENSYVVTMDDVPPVQKEAYSGNINNYMSSLVFELAYTKFPNGGVEMYSTDWGSVSEKIYRSESFGGQLGQDRHYKDDVDRLVEGVTSQNEKALKIYEYVRSTMNHNGFIGMYTQEGLKKAYQEKVGNVADINLLLVSMLRYVGINANPILISTKSHGVPVFPTRNGFNYVIAGLEQNGQVILLDASDKFGAPNILDEELLNWQGRLIREDGSSTWIALQSQKPSQEMFMVNYKIDGNAEIEGQSKGQYTDYLALERRKDFSGASSEEIKNKIKGLNADFNDFHLENAKNPYEPIKMDFSFHSSDYLEEIDGKYYLSPMLFMALQENPFKMNDRKYPIDYGFSKQHRYIINIEVPDGYTLESMPENASMILGDNAFIFKYLLSHRGNTIQLMVDFTINKYLIDPSMYSEVKKFYQDLVDKEKEQIVFAKA